MGVETVESLNENVKNVLQDERLTNYDKMKIIMGLPEDHPKIVISNEIMKVYKEYLDKRNNGDYGQFGSYLTNYELFKLAKKEVYGRYK